MTGEAFGRLLYTDCKPGTGRGAGGGFQVQAQSSDVDAAQGRLAAGNLLYEVQVPWISELREPEEFPLGLAHAGDGNYGTAQGRYIGRAAVGGRMGNHLADCLLTADPGLYGLVRPAQLWRADFWRDRPWEGTDCPPLDAADLSPGPLGVEAVADWARAVPGRGTSLARLVSLLEDPEGRRAIIVSDTPDEAVLWIAAATLLLPADAAVDVSFKVFSAAPLDARQRIVAAPAALYPKISPGTSERFVLDARDGRCDEVSVSERAAFFAGRFTAPGEDPYDIVDAVELAAALGGNRDARLTAWAMTRPDEPRPEPEALSRWLSAADSGRLADYGAAVTDLVMSDGPDARVLRWIDAAVSGRRLDADPVIVRAGLLDAELSEVRAGKKPPVTEVLPAADLDPETLRDAESHLSSALLLDDKPGNTDLLLCLARRHGIELDLVPPLQQQLRDFATAWISHPAGYHPDGWALRDEILDCAHDELRQRINDRDEVAESVVPVLERVNGCFADRTDMSDRLDRHIQASLIADRRDGKRIDRLRRLLAIIADFAESPGQEAAATEAAEGLQQALVQWGAADGDVAVTVLSDLPGSLDVEPVISGQAAQELERRARRPSSDLLDLLGRLHQRQRMPESKSLARLAEADWRVRSFVGQTGDVGPNTDPRRYKNIAGLLPGTESAVLSARAGEIVSALARSRNPRLTAAVLDALGSKIARQLVDHWAETLGTRDLTGDGAWAAWCMDDDAVPQKVQASLRSATQRYARELERPDREKWYGDVRRALPPGVRATWESIFAPADDGRSRSRPRAGRDRER